MPMIRRATRTSTGVGLACLAVAVLLGAAFSPTPVPAGRPVPQVSGTGSAPPRFAEVDLSTGVRMHYAVQGSPSGRPVILLHGYGDSWFSWSRVLPLFPADLRVYALDLRGHGGTSRPEAGYSLTDMAEDVLAFMDAQAIARSAVVGHSMGSLVAQHVAAGAPGRISRLVLVGSTPREDALLAGIAGSRLLPYAETGHAPHWERPEQFARDVVEFIASR